MPNIDDLPTAVTPAGQDHNYTGPAAASVVMVNAPVNPPGSGSEIVVGKNRAAYDAFIGAEIAAGRAHQSTIQNLDPRRGFILDMDVNEASRYNYARVTVGGGSWYLFIDRFEWRSAHSIVFFTTVDPFATYSWALGYSMVNRGHVAIAASQGDTYGTQYCLTPEPISAPPEVGVMHASILDMTDADWTIMVISANDLRGNGTDTPFFLHHVEEVNLALTQELAYTAGVSPAPEGDGYYPAGGGDHGFSENQFETSSPWQQGSQYFVPSVRPSRISTVDGITQGGGAYLFTPAGWDAYQMTMQNAPWVLEGIVDVRRVPTWALTGGGGPIGSWTTLPPVSPTEARWAEVAGIPQFVEVVNTNGYDTTVLGGWREDYLASVGGGLFRKLITSQFVKISVGNGSSMIDYAPENMQSSGVQLHARTGTALGEPSIRLTADYNDLGTQLGIEMPTGGSVGVVAAGYGRAASNTASAVLGPLNAAFTNHSSRSAMIYNYDLAKHFNIENIPVNMGIIGVQSVLNAAGGAALAGMAGGGPLGAAAGAVIGGGAAAITAGVSANASIDMMDVSKVGSMDIATYQLGVNGLFNAMSYRTWVQALRSVSGKGQNAAVVSGWREVTGEGFEVIVIAPARDRVRQLISTWRRYGYMIGRAFTPDRLDVMTRYSYWQTEGAVITGAMPHEDRQRIAAAFDAGVTVYGSLSDIGADVSTSNTPVSGVSY